MCTGFTMTNKFNTAVNPTAIKKKKILVKSCNEIPNTSTLHIFFISNNT